MSLYTYILIFGVVIAVFLGFFIWYITQFKHRLIIHRITGSKSIDYVVKFRVVRDRDGVDWWCPAKHQKIFGAKIKPFPNKCIMVTPKGAMSVSCTWDGFKKFQFLIPNTDNKGQEYEVLTDEQKAIYLKMMRDSETWKKPSISELIGKFASLGAIVIIVIALMVFYGDMAKPLITMGGQLQSFQNQQAEMQKVFQEVIQGKKWIDESYTPPSPQEPDPNYMPPS